MISACFLTVKSGKYTILKRKKLTQFFKNITFFYQSSILMTNGKKLPEKFLSTSFNIFCNDERKQRKWLKNGISLPFIYKKSGNLMIYKH